MVLAVKELPGGIGTGVDCPHCSKTYPHLDHNGENPDDLKKLTVPDTCERCGSPMDEAGEIKFHEARSKVEQQSWPGRSLKAKASSEGVI